MNGSVSIWQGATTKSIITGAVLAVVMCTANSYLTLKAGVIEEGPIISALIFTAIFFSLRRTVTTTEAVIVATMGSAGGAFGFVSNLFAAYEMAGVELTTTQMVLFTLSTGMLGVLMAIPFYYLFVIRDPLPWPVGQACASVIKNTVATRDAFQGKVILWFSLAFFVILLVQGGGWIPAATTLFVVGAAGVGLAWSPFFLSVGGILGLRMGIGFLIGATALILIAPYTTSPEAPHRFFWPGVAFLISSGITALALRWRTVVGAVKAVRFIRGGSSEEKIMPTKWLVSLIIVTMVVVVIVLRQAFGIAAYLGATYVIVGTLFLNLIATRAMGETSFNPARAMGIVLQGVGAATGGTAKLVNLAGAGMVASGCDQTGILNQDLNTGRLLGVNPRLQMALQACLFPVIALVSVGAYRFVSSIEDISMTNDALPAPVAKAWAGFAQLMEGGSLPPIALQLMVIFGTIGIVLAVAESFPKMQRVTPSTTGIGIGLILPVAYSVDFFLGAIIFLFFARMFGMSKETQNSLAAAGILGEAAGGLLAGALTAGGFF